MKTTVVALVCVPVTVTFSLAPVVSLTRRAFSVGHTLPTASVAKAVTGTSATPTTALSATAVKSQTPNEKIPLPAPSSVHKPDRLSTGVPAFPSSMVTVIVSPIVVHVPETEYAVTFH